VSSAIEVQRKGARRASNTDRHWCEGFAVGGARTIDLVHMSHMRSTWFGKTRTLALSSATGS
jgi:hypothetical protein